MRIYIAVFVLCAVACAESFRVARDTEEVSSTEASTTAAPEECCYPRPPKSRKFRRCCEIPMEQIYEKFDQDLQECKEQNQKKEEDEPAKSTTTTPAPPMEEETPDLENFVDSNEDMDEPTPAAAAAEGAKTGRNHKGRCHKRHHRGKGKCVKATMEKHGWSNNGTLNWDMIEKASDEATSEQGKNWAQIMKKAIQVCKQEPYLQPTEPEAQAEEHDEKDKDESGESKEKSEEKKKGKHHDGKHGHRGKRWTVERAAFRCMKNNAVMNCPNFPEDDAYCMELRNVYNRCGARKQPGKKPIRWCDGEGRKGHKNHKNKA